jgi:hypothetical protein
MMHNSSSRALFITGYPCFTSGALMGDLHPIMCTATPAGIQWQWVWLRPPPASHLHHHPWHTRGACHISGCCCCGCHQHLAGPVNQWRTGLQLCSWCSGKQHAQACATVFIKLMVCKVPAGITY